MNKCQQCGKECNRKFCSISCSNKYWNPITKTGKYKENSKGDEIITLELVCGKCGKDFSVTRERKKLTGKNIPKYCSSLCSHSREVSQETRQKISKGVNAFNATLPIKEKKPRYNVDENGIRYKLDSEGNRLYPKRLRKRFLSKNICKCGNIVAYGAKYCSQKCDIDARRNIKIAQLLDGKINGEGTLRKYVLLVKPHQCEICKNTEWMGDPIPLTLDHINGRAHDNTYENLRLICPNCDRKLPTYGNKNKNSDRKDRYLKSRNK